MFHSASCAIRPACSSACSSVGRKKHGSRRISAGYAQGERRSVCDRGIIRLRSVPRQPCEGDRTFDSELPAEERWFDDRDDRDAVVLLCCVGSHVVEQQCWREVVRGKQRT